MFWKKKTVRDFLPFPVKAAHAEYSMIFSAHDDPACETLLDLALQAATKAKNLDLSDISSRLKTPPLYPNIWPGEHYKLLAAFVDLLQPEYAVEIGTYTGLSSLCMKKFLPKKSKLITYDITPWHDFKETVFIKQDFSDQRLIQFIDNLADPFLFKKHRFYLENASFIFIDATHDGYLEKTLFDLFETLSFKKNPVILLDDIRVWSMLKMWREIKKPKLDITSLGHWSGTGLVQW